MRRISLAIILLCLPALAWAQVNTLPSAPHILVKGHAEGTYVPDRFTIHLTVDVVDKLPGKARDKVEAHIGKVFEALKKAGALDKRTRASSMQITPDFDYKDGERVFNGTQVMRTVQATFDSLQKLREFIAYVPADKEVQISSTEVGRSDIERIRQQLRKAAIANSKQAAKHMAEAYGMRITGIYSVSEVAPNFAYGIRAGSWNMASGMPFGSGMPPPGPPPPPSMPPKVVKMVSAPPNLRIGTIKVQMNMYAVYLTEPK